MTAWYVFTSSLWFIGHMGGMIPLLRLRHAQRLRGWARLGSFANKRRWETTRGRDAKIQLETKAAKIGERWNRPGRSGWWVALAAWLQWLFSLGVLSELRNGSDIEAVRATMLWISSLVMTSASLLFAGLLIVRYQRGEKRPFAALSATEKIVFASAATGVLLAMATYSNAPLPK